MSTIEVGASGGGSVVSIDVSGGTTGLTSSGGPVIETGTITLAGTLVVANGGTGATSAANARTNLGLVIGTNVQGQSAVLQAIADGTDLPIADGGTGASSAAAARTNLGIDNSFIRSIGITLDGGGSAISTGIKGDVMIPYGCTINSVTMLADQSGSMVVDIWKDTYANYPPTVADTVVAAAKPTISAALKSQDAVLTGWTTAIAAGDTLRFNVDSCSSITRCTLVLKVTCT